PLNDGVLFTLSTTVLLPSPSNEAHGSALVSSGTPLTARTYSPSFTATPGSSSGERTGASHGPPRTIRLMRYAPLVSSQSTPSIPTDRFGACSMSPPPW